MPSFFAGPFDIRYLKTVESAEVTYSFSDYPTSLSLGTIGPEGIRQTVTIEGEEIVGDNLGGTVQDGVFQGANVFWEFVAEEVRNTVLKDLLWAHNIASAATVEGKVGDVGRLWTSYGGSLLLVPLGTASPYSQVASTPGIWAPRVVIENGHELASKMGAFLDTVPIRLRLLPSIEAGGTIYLNSYHFKRVALA